MSNPSEIVLFWSSDLVMPTPKFSMVMGLATLADLIWMAGLVRDGVLLSVSEVMEMKHFLSHASATLDTILGRKMLRLEQSKLMMMSMTRPTLAWNLMRV